MPSVRVCCTYRRQMIRTEQKEVYQIMVRQRRGPEGHPGMAGPQRHRHHQQHLHAPQLQLQGELRPGHPGHSPGRQVKLVRLPMRKMTSGTSETPSAQAGQAFRNFGFPGNDVPEVRLATTDATKMASDFHRKTAKPRIKRDPTRAQQSGSRGEKEAPRSTAEEKPAAASDWFF